MSIGFKTVILHFCVMYQGYLVFLSVVVRGTYNYLYKEKIQKFLFETFFSTFKKIQITTKMHTYTTKIFKGPQQVLKLSTMRLKLG